MTPEQAALAEALAARIIGSNKALRILPGFLDHVLLGLVIGQCLIYTRFVKTDKKHIVAFVVASVMCTLASTIDILLWLTEIFVWHFSEYLIFSDGSYIYRLVVIDIVSTFVVQAFYVDRAYRLHRHWWPLAFLGTVVFTALGVGAGFISVIAKKFIRLDSSVVDDPTVKTMAYTWLILISLADLSITVVMVWGLDKNKTGWQHTDSHLKGLVVRCFEAQLPALVIAIATLISWNQKLEIAIVFLMSHSKVYTLGLLVTLNFRANHNTDSPAQSYKSDATSGSYGLSEVSGKHRNVVVVDREIDVSIDQGQHWDMSRRNRVLDVEESSAHSTHSINPGHSDHPFAQTHGRAEWESTTALHELPHVHVRGAGRGY
ncbi:uncharacterized protein MKK02DRAFT_44689 [Dioszegia hungarica]|uniref:DUF6534 domain-containing protein n=1 Tax=Dioszegia hungarica TaxID=4972 RepID=A0AA38H9H9_9TREE|nr:uncharacterized protein MKK02DRAFT_44689 [Dioszegia hungarica]KAI9635991.1 hypothetical protein MKK02DRAFT_44689 [Dioszegia hungarica]